jgi:hypothetical protein
MKTVHEITEIRKQQTKGETNYSLSGDYNTETGTNTHKIQSESLAA